MERSNLSAIVLSAGMSSRIGGFKPLLPLAGKTLLEHVLSLYRSVGISDIRVVAGYRGDELIPPAERFGARVVFNPDFQTGMFSSVVAGIVDLSPGCSGFFIHPVDIPLVRCETLIALRKAFQQGKSSVYYPSFQERRGHPPLISAIHVKAIQSWHGRGGLRMFLRNHQDDATDVPVGDPFILKDIDTPEDYAWALNFMVPERKPMIPARIRPKLSRKRPPVPF
ncbi:nucleotidyltransferase family protein [Desulfatirhabdium butyrativorans]|uniref:nucleotidyltransferase family protein n=1 Tax=Desulfatirhabdium butyrativorans TaxID=340467 RepID=UPI0003F76F5B|nr:nucleotidyltransferase family protein [Desulfatirhabdium butyrativorans]